MSNKRVKRGVNRFATITQIHEGADNEKELPVEAKTEPETPERHDERKVVEQEKEEKKNSNNEKESSSASSEQKGIDVLKFELNKEVEEISGKVTNFGMHNELYQLLGQISDNAGITLKQFGNNIIYDWLLNNPEVIQRAKKMAKDRGGLAKKFL